MYVRIRSIRRITNDANHNAFTGVCYFKGALYVAYREGAAHADPTGKIIVLRSNDEGKHFETVAVFRKQSDARDAHLYSDGQKLYAVGFEADSEKKYWKTFTAWTEDGRNWSEWTETQGTEGFILWKPQFHKGKYYCAGYGEFERGKSSTVAWFESDDAVRWERKYDIHKGKDIPTECYLDFFKNDVAVMIMRCDDKTKKPYLCKSEPPYRKWDMVRLDIPLLGPCLWVVNDEIWISGRWFLHPDITHVGVFKIKDNKSELRLVLPSGPGFDISYMGATRDPENPSRFWFSYYSGHTAPQDPDIDQFSHPDIYLVEALFYSARNFICDWLISDVKDISLDQAKYCDSRDKNIVWRKISAYKDAESSASVIGFVDAGKYTKGKKGVIYFTTDVDLGPIENAKMYLGYDGPVIVWLNGQQIFSGPGTNPAIVDKTKIPINARHGRNTITIALDTNGGKAEGIFCKIVSE